MPEAIFICLDSSDYSRNGTTKHESRLSAISKPLQVYIASKINDNPENIVGLLSMSRKSNSVLESLTRDTDRLFASLNDITSSGELDLYRGIQTARLAMAHKGSLVKKRILAIICSPLKENSANLSMLAKSLAKDGVSIDIVNLGNSCNEKFLELFTINRPEDGEVTIISIKSDEKASALTLQSIQRKEVIGERVSVDIHSLSGGQSVHSSSVGGGFQDSNREEMDPDLALAIQLSLQEMNKNDLP